VDVFRALFELGEGGQGIACFRVTGVIDLHQDGTIPLNDERIGGIVIHYAQSLCGETFCRGALAAKMAKMAV
jgi:hypothetical protein